jgi:hypothetical protein
MGFEVWGSEFGVWDLGLFGGGGMGLGKGGDSLGFQVWDLGFGVWVWGLGFGEKLPVAFSKRDQTLAGLLWEECRESKRGSRNTIPESRITSI